MSLFNQFILSALSQFVSSTLQGAPMVSTTSTVGRPTISSICYQNGPGWSAAHVKRLSLKKRNQQRNKRAHRAKGKNHGIRTRKWQDKDGQER